MSAELTESTIIQTLDWTYDNAINGIPGFYSVEELANSYMKSKDSKTSQANSLIRWQNIKAGTSGFILGVGGIVTMPVTMPINITSVIYVQIRMIAAIAYIGGHDLKDDKVKSLVYACLAGNAAKDILKDIGIVVGTKLSTNVIKNISGKIIIEINKKVGFRLLTKFGEKGVINLGKVVPIIGGVIGATFDSVSTNTIGNIARDTFIPAASA